MWSSCGGWQCQLVHTVRRHHSTSTPLTARKSLVCLVRSSGQLVPRQLHGCGVAGKEPVLGKPSRGYFICSAVTHPHPPFLLHILPAPLFFISWKQQERQLADAARKRRVRLCVYLHGARGSQNTSDITAKLKHLNSLTNVLFCSWLLVLLSTCRLLFVKTEVSFQHLSDIIKVNLPICTGFNTTCINKVNWTFFLCIKHVCCV